MKKLIATAFSICLALGSAGALAQASSTKEGTKSTDGAAKDAMNRGAVERKDAQNRMQSPSTTPQQPGMAKGSSSTTDGMAKDAMNKGALDRKDSAARISSGTSKPTAAETQGGNMQKDPMKKDKDGMRK